MLTKLGFDLKDRSAPDPQVPEERKECLYRGIHQGKEKKQCGQSPMPSKVWGVVQMNCGARMPVGKLIGRIDV